MKRRLSFQSLIILVFLGSMIPLMVMVGLVVFRLQQSYLINDAQSRLIGFVQAGVEQYTGQNDLTTLAVNLGEHLRVLGADLFIQDADGNPVPPSLGTGPWLSDGQHQAARQSLTSTVQMIGEGSAARIVYLATVVDKTGLLLGSVEASLPLAAIQDQLDALRRWLILIITLASAVSVLLIVSLSRLMTRPLKSLVDSVEQVRTGHLEQRAPVPDVEELRQLAVTHNLMLDRISADFEKQTQLAENMRQFAGDISHELRSPLSVFRNSVDLLSRFSATDSLSADDGGTDDGGADRRAVVRNEQFAEILAILRKEVDTMTLLVENLLLLASLDQPEETLASVLHREELHPFPLLEEVYERSLLLVQGQQIELVWPSGEINPIWADREMVRRSLNNLVENAIRYTPPGKKISLSVENSDEYCRFIVEDQGPGIPSDQLPRIFDRFFRSDASRSRQTSGTGLGLSIVAAIVRAHSGEVQVESQPGQGTRFCLSFRTQPVQVY